MSVPVLTLKKNGKYPLSGTVHVFLLLVLLVSGRQTVPIFNTQDITSFFLSKLSGTGL